MTDARIKPITSRDIAELIALGESAGLSPWTAQNYVDELKNPNSIMLRLESEENLSIGFVVGRLVPAVDNDTDIDAEIYNIAVSEGARKSGCGTLLLNEFIATCQNDNVRNIWLEVRESNHGAVNFYKNREFLAISKRLSFYRDPVEDAILMRRELNAESEPDE